MGAECRGIDHLGIIEVHEDAVRVSCVSCDQHIAVPLGSLDPRRSLKLPVSFEVGPKRHVHEREEVHSPYGDMNICRTCTRHLAPHTFGGGPDAEGVVWRPPRCSLGAHDYHVLGGTAPSDPATCVNCGDITTVEEALG